MKTSRETFDKSERLCSTKIISGLFEDGNIFHTGSFKVVWSLAPAPLPYPAQAAFSVAKRSFRLAVTRNLIKRRIREAYRKDKNRLYEFLTGRNLQIVMIAILRGSKVPDYPSAAKSVREMIDRLMNEIRQNI